MDHLGIYGADIAVGTLHVHEDPPYRSDDLGAFPHRDDDAGTLVGLSPDTLPVYNIHAHRPTVAPSGDMVP